MALFCDICLKDGKSVEALGMLNLNGDVMVGEGDDARKVTLNLRINPVGADMCRDHLIEHVIQHMDFVDIVKKSQIGPPQKAADGSRPPSLR